MDIFRLTAFVLIKQYIHSLSWDGAHLVRISDSELIGDLILRASAKGNMKSKIKQKAEKWQKN